MSKFTVNYYYYQVRKIDKVISLSLMMIVIYTVIGFCLASLRINLGLWGLAIFFYHWHLANFEHLNINYTRENYCQHSLLVALTSGLMSSAITMLVHQVKSQLPIYQAIAIGLIAVINSSVMMVLTIRDWGSSKLIVYSTALAWLGLLLGLAAQNY